MQLERTSGICLNTMKSVIVTSRALTRSSTSNICTLKSNFRGCLGRAIYLFELLRIKMHRKMNHTVNSRLNIFFCLKQVWSRQTPPPLLRKQRGSDGLFDGRTDQGTVRLSYRDARTHLKRDDLTASISKTSSDAKALL